MVHAHGIYDLKVDISSLSAQQAAQEIHDFVQNHSHHQAFKKLAENMKN